MFPMPAPVQLRPFAPADAAAVAHLQNAACREQWTVTAADVRAQSGTRWVAEADGTPAASARLSPFGRGAEDALRLSLCGDAKHFSGLYLAALSAANLSGFARVLAVTREDWAEQVGFLQAAGFANVWQSFGAHLDLTRFDFRCFAARVERLYQQGDEVRELVQTEGQSSLDELYALHLHFADAPATPVTSNEHLSRDEFAAKLREWRTWVLWRGREAVAYTSVHFPYGQPDSAGTVTRRGERRQRLALALKAHALDQLRQEGFTRASTGGAVANLPMLRVNLRLGYRPEPLWLTFERRL